MGCRKTTPPAQITVEFNRSQILTQTLSTMRIRKLLNKLLLPTGHVIAKCRDYPQFTERRVFESMVRSSSPPRTIVDVGANVGQSASSFAREIPEAEVYALEPFQKTFDALRANVQSLKNVHAFKLAAGDRCGMCEVFRNADVTSQVNSLVEARQSTLKNHAAATESIELVTLDRFCQDRFIGAIDILKTDTEGYDVEVLTGATELLAAHKITAVICEVGMDGDPWHTSFFKVVNLLKKYGMETAGFYETDYQLDGRFSHTNALFVNHCVEK